MSLGSPFISIFPGPIQFTPNYTYTIYYVRTRIFNHVVFTANQAFSETRYSLGFRNDKHMKLIMVSPDLSLNESTEDQTHVLATDMLTEEQCNQLNALVFDFSHGVFKTKDGIETYYGTDSKKRNYSIFGNNCTSVLAAIFPTAVKGLGCVREFANTYLTRMGGKKRKNKKTVRSASNRRTNKINIAIKKMRKTRRGGGREEGPVEAQLLQTNPNLLDKLTAALVEAFNKTPASMAGQAKVFADKIQRLYPDPPPELRRALEPWADGEPAPEEKAEVDHAIDATEEIMPGANAAAVQAGGGWGEKLGERVEKFGKNAYIVINLFVLYTAFAALLMVKGITLSLLNGVVAAHDRTMTPFNGPFASIVHSLRMFRDNFYMLATLNPEHVGQLYNSSVERAPFFSAPEEKVEGGRTRARRRKRRRRTRR